MNNFNDSMSLQSVDFLVAKSNLHHETQIPEKSQFIRYSSSNLTYVSSGVPRMHCLGTGSCGLRQQSMWLNVVHVIQLKQGKLEFWQGDLDQ
ncbi:hypothetical protein HAX54_032824 [Datura stramonium]|uniref:Uncharacterized protein n=1 Tax=Datura stramonium TaxID=4076 RepID=A0ABS8SCX9_DATST|nr:hypothetical protein [Datura stramonium]